MHAPFKFHGLESRFHSSSKLRLHLCFIIGRPFLYCYMVSKLDSCLLYIIRHGILNMLCYTLHFFPIQGMTAIYCNLRSEFESRMLSESSVGTASERLPGVIKVGVIKVVRAPAVYSHAQCATGFRLFPYLVRLRGPSFFHFPIFDQHSRHRTNYFSLVSFVLNRQCSAHAHCTTIINELIPSLSLAPNNLRYSQARV